MGVLEKNFYHGFLSDIDILQPLKDVTVEKWDEVRYPRLHPKQVPGDFFLILYFEFLPDAYFTNEI